MNVNFGQWLETIDPSDLTGRQRDVQMDFLEDCKDTHRDSAYYTTPEMLYERLIDMGACDGALEGLRELAIIFGVPIEDDEDEDDSWAHKDDDDDDDKDENEDEDEN